MSFTNSFLRMVLFSEPLSKGELSHFLPSGFGVTLGQCCLCFVCSG